MNEKKLQQYMDILGYRDIPDFFKKYLSSPSLLRLKNIGYFCGMDYASKDIYDFGERVSRYDHSLTVALITWNLTGDKKATLAGLFHDISTPCFSHVVDYMNKDYEKQESTEEKTEEIINSDAYLLNCLEQDGIKSSEIINFKSYSIVDIDRPMLCADRLDGIILTGLFWTKNISIDDVRNIILDLIVVNNENNLIEIAFKNDEVAKLVFNTNELIDVYCHSKEDNYMMELLAKITKRGMELSLVSYDDLFKLDEDNIFERFNKSDDIELIKDLYLFRNVKKSDIPNVDMPSLKIRKLNPLVGNKRIR